MSEPAARRRRAAWRVEWYRYGDSNPGPVAEKRSRTHRRGPVASVFLGHSHCRFDRLWTSGCVSCAEFQFFFKSSQTPSRALVDSAETTLILNHLAMARFWIAPAHVAIAEGYAATRFQGSSLTRHAEYEVQKSQPQLAQRRGSGDPPR